MFTFHIQLQYSLNLENKTSKAVLMTSTVNGIFQQCKQHDNKIASKLRRKFEQNKKVSSNNKTAQLKK